MRRMMNSLTALMTIAGLLGGVLLMTMRAYSVSAAPVLSDVRGHWAEPNILNWASKGLVGGKPNGLFQPDKPLTRAEFVSFVNRAFGYTEGSSAVFTDVKPGDWFALEVALAVKAGYIPNASNGAFYPNAQVSRLEAAVMLYRAMHLYRESFADVSGSIGDIAAVTAGERIVIDALVGKKLMVGSGGQFSPTRPMTRAEAVAILDRSAGAIYNRAGEYGPETGRSTLTGNATISAAGVTLRNLTINGDLFVTEGVGDGDVTLENVVVMGRTLVAGCGSQSLNLVDGTSLGQSTIVDRPNGNPHIDDNTGNSEAGTVVFYSSGSYTSDNEGGNPPDVLLPADMEPDAQVDLSGVFGNVDVRTPHGAALTLSGAAAESLTIGNSARGIALGLTDTTVDQLNLNGQANLTMYSGSVGQLDMRGSAGSTLNFLGGTVGQMNLSGQSSVFLTGGAIEHLVVPAGASGSSLVLNGGSVGEVNLPGGGQLTIGGTITGTLTITGAGAGSVITISSGTQIGNLIVPEGVEVITEAGASVGKVTRTPPPGDTTPPVVTANPPGGTYAETIFVELRASKPSTIYYTTDGSTPAAMTARYTHKIAVYENTTLKYFAVDLAGNQSAIQTETYVILVGGGGGGGTPPGLSANADLSNLTLSTGTLIPAFSPSLLEYTTTVASDVASLSVTPTVAESHASVTVNGVAVASGSASPDIALNPGSSNIIRATVTAQDRRTRTTYTVTVTRIPVIERIDNEEASIEVNEPYLLPETVTAVMNDGTTREYPVTWAPPVGVPVDDGYVSISVVGGYVFIGRVEGYEEDVALLLAVNRSTDGATIRFWVVE